MNKDKEKIIELLKRIDDLSISSERLINMLEMLDGYVESYENKYSDFWRLKNFIESMLKLHYSINECILNFDDILTK